MLSEYRRRIRTAIADRVNTVVVLADEIESALRGLDDETPIRAIVRQRDELQDAFDSTLQTLHDERQRFVQFTAHAADLRTQVANACADRDEALRARDGAKAAVGVLAAEVDRMREALREQAATAHERRTQIQSEAETLQRALTDSQAELAKVKAERDRERANAQGYLERLRAVNERKGAQGDDLAGLAAHASKPEPPPKNEGDEVTPMLINWLRRTSIRTDRFDCGRGLILGAPIEPVIALLQARAAFGLAKYGQPLRTRDGRDSVEDARQEAGDLLQYLFKARVNGENIESLAPVLACVDYVRAAFGVYFGGSEN